ncbi:MAG TPA: S8 family peptidase [Solirubrobacteraceae bacterium]|nr:S8 family peptidase [Solirubrobacteraceae bacterium]
MKLEFKNLGPWIFGTEQLKRFTQDSPVMPDVWLQYGREPDDPIDLLLEPHADATTAELAQAVLEADFSAQEPAPLKLGYNQSHVAVELTFREMLRSVLPLSRWWQEHLWPAGTTSVADVLSERREEIVAGLQEPMREQGRRPVGEGELPGALVWFVGLVGRIWWEAGRDPGSEQPDDEPPKGLTYDRLVDVAADALGELERVPPAGRPLLWSINRNRPARPALHRSRNTIKADAAALLFDLRCSELCWAVVDSGIDATHPAFCVRGADGRPTGASRVRATYDFTRLREILAGDDAERDTLGGAAAEQRKEIESRLRSGRAIDWGLLSAQLLVDTGAAGYAPPRHEHGTHVAGILAADWQATDSDPPRKHDIRGICPDIGVYDLRVFDDAGDGDEFAILAALQFVRWLNANSPVPVLHGVNLSLSLDHEVGSYACGRTPVCEECERLIGSGTIVVAAAGNEGRAFVSMASGTTEGYRQMSITDPGNATGVITVGATHRHQPHTYGVSYFSSRGPTGDGRAKPDLVAPGEKITAPVPGGGLKSLDGTSMAAPHVSGAAALILARHPELIGQPAAIKHVLCATATDLGRERHFQGSGVVDALRAIQSV